MRFEIGHQPMFATLNLTLDEDDSIVAQPESMISMTTGIEIIARIGGQTGQGVKGGLRNLMSGESFFATVFEIDNDRRCIGKVAALRQKITLPIGDAEVNNVTLQTRCERQRLGISLAAKYGGKKTFARH